MIKNNEPEFVHGFCEMCGTEHNNRDLYIDVFNNLFTLECPTCFINRTKNEQDYYERIKYIVPVFTKQQFDKLKNHPIVIGDCMPYLKDEPFLSTEVDDCVKNALKRMFDCQKIKNKFEPVDVKFKTGTEKTDNGLYVLKVVISASVKFRSYIEYLEHEAYMYFRKEVKTVFN